MTTNVYVVSRDNLYCYHDTTDSAWQTTGAFSSRAKANKHIKEENAINGFPIDAYKIERLKVQ